MIYKYILTINTSRMKKHFDVPVQRRRDLIVRRKTEKIERVHGTRGEEILRGTIRRTALIYPLVYHSRNVRGK